MHKNRIRESIKFFISKFEINISKFEINISKFEINISKFEIKKFNVSATLSNAVLKGFEITRLLFRVSSRKSGRQCYIREKGIRRRKKQKRELPKQFSLWSGTTRNRTGDTRIFSPLLYQLSYGTIIKNK